MLKLFGRLLKVGHRPTGETCLAEGKTPKKVIVAVHGIGDQVRYTTVQAVGRQFFRYVGLAGALPLGALYSVLKREPPTARQGCYGFLPSSEMGDLGLAEVYWADIPRVPETELYTVEETKAWARTVVERLRLRHEMQTEKSDLELTDLDVLTMKEVLSEMIDTIRILEWLLAWVERQTKFTFPLKQVLTDYLGDVQIVADYKPFRRKIVDEFHAVLSGICSVKSPPEIYIVAHSEGTVVSLLAMLEAMNEKSGIDGGWVKQVRGFMTIGSPIDKHLILWPELFASFEPKTAAELHLGEVSWRKMETIQWCNYYDYGDPIGFDLNTARDWLATKAEHPPIEFLSDTGFSRYVFPGEAHNEYWRDDAVFQDFIRKMGIFSVDGVVRQPKKPQTLRDRPLFSVLSAVIPYVLVTVLCTTATWLLYKTTAGSAEIDPCKFDLSWNVGVLGLALTLATAAGRIPRLARARRWFVLAAGLLLLTVAVVHYGPTENLERAVSWSVAGKSAGGQTIARRCQTQATAIEWYSRLTGRGEPSGTTPSATASGTPLFKNPASPVTNGFVIVSVLIILSGWVGARLPRWGMTPMLVTGGLGVIVLILLPLLYGITGISLWPAAIAWLGFLYLWWLAALIFDLSFVWHRYICQNLGLAHLQELSTGKRVQRDRQQM